MQLKNKRKKSTEATKLCGEKGKETVFNFSGTRWQIKLFKKISNVETWQLLWKVGGKQEVRHRTWSRRGRPAHRSRWRGHSQTVPCSTSRRWRSADPGRGADLWANQTTASNLKKSLRSKVTLAAFERCGKCGGTLFHKFFFFFNQWFDFDSSSICTRIHYNKTFMYTSILCW